MIGHSLLVMLRQMRRNKLMTAINLMSLTVGLTAALLITLYSRHHLTFDQFHENGDRLQLVLKERHLPSGIQVLDDTWIPLADLMTSTYPEVESATRLVTLETIVTIRNEEFMVSDVLVADPNLFDLFSFPLLYGNPARALTDPTGVVVSRDFAMMHYGRENPMGETLITDEGDLATITGVLAPIPEESSYRPELVFPFRAMVSEEREKQAQQDWGGSFLETWLLLKSDTDPKALEPQFASLIEKQFGTSGSNGSDNMKFKLLSLDDLHDQNTNTRSVAWTLLAFAGVILLIASINFTNLSTARSIQRAREVGMRKVLGAGRPQLIRHFLGESLLLTFLSVVLAVGLAEVLLPWMNQLVNLNLDLSVFRQPSLLAIGVLFTLLLGLGAGFYPAFVLSRFRPIRTLKGQQVRGPQSTILRNGLVVVQFTLTVALLIATAVVWQQIQFMKTANLNLEDDGVVVLPLNTEMFSSAESAPAEIEGMVNALAAGPGISSVSASFSTPGSYSNANIFARPEGWEEDAPLRWMVSAADVAYFPLYEVPFAAGGNWGVGQEASNESRVILNETAAREAGWSPDEAIGMTIKMMGGEMTVVGVVKDFHYTALNSCIRPLAHIFSPADSPRHLVNWVSIKLAAGDLRPALDFISQTWEERIPSLPLEMTFVDEHFRSLYVEQEKFGSLASAFAVLAILIASFGLFGLITYSTALRTKEIGVRRVLGADTRRLLGTLMSGFLIPVFLANLPAWLIAWAMMSRWLENYPYRMQLTVLPFLLSTLLAVMIAAGTLIVQSLRAARTNPVDALRYE